MKIYTKESVKETLMNKHLKLLEEYYFYAESIRLEICTNEIDQFVEELYDLSIKNTDLLSEMEIYILRKNFGIYNNGVSVTRDFIGNELNIHKGQIELICKRINERITNKIVKKIKENLKLTKIELVNLPIEYLDLSHNTYNFVKRANINKIGDLTNMTINEIRHIKYFQAKNEHEVVKKIHELGLTFKTENITLIEQPKPKYTKTIEEIEQEINNRTERKKILLQEKRALEERKAEINQELEKQNAKIRKLERIRTEIEKK